jgi:hypothetical protein
VALKRYPLQGFPGQYFPPGTGDLLSKMGELLPGQYRSGHMFQIDTDIISYTRISLRVLFKLPLAPVAAEVILLIFVYTGEISIFFINYHQTDWIGCHGWLPR